MRIRLALGIVAGACSALLALGGARAASIHFTATDLEDSTPGEDLWEYAYSLEPGATVFSAGVTGFAIAFDETRYAALQAVSSGLDWDVLTLQPEPALPDPGLYDALPWFDAPDTSAPFVVDFVWLGPGAPGSQPFQVYALSYPYYGEPVTIESGVTVPEPALCLLALAAALPLARSRGRQPR